MSTMERIRREVREIGLVTVYFLLCFGFFLTLKKLILLQYEVRVTVLGTAALAAIVVAKVVILLGNTSFGNLFRSHSLALHVVWRTLAYTAMVFVVTLAERTFEAYRAKGHLEGVLSEVWTGEGLGHFLAMNMTVGVSLLVYNVYSEIDAQLGEGTLRKLFFSRHGHENGRVELDATAKS
jgi:hypothetical protein